MKKCKYCKKIVENKKSNLCKECKKKYNEIYHNMAIGNFIIWYYNREEKLIRVKKKKRIVSILKDKKILEYIKLNNVSIKTINIQISDATEYNDEITTKLVKYIELEENALIKRKKGIAKKDKEKIGKIYQELNLKKTNYKTWKIKQKLDRKKRLEKLRQNNFNEFM